jgi:hypothetical protein
MTRLDLVKQLAQQSNSADATPEPPHAPDTEPGAGQSSDLFIWFEDTSSRRRDGRRGIAGLPESLLPYAAGMRVVDRRYCDGHVHLLSAVRVRCREFIGERIAAIYTAALSVGTVAWIGTGSHYDQVWRDMYPDGACGHVGTELPTGH